MRDPYGRRRRPLARLSGGRPGRAALILVGSYVAALPVAWAGWVLGQAPAFDDARPAAYALVGALGLATVGTLVLVFGSWPMPTGVGLRLSRGYGERYDSFGSPAGFRLGLLRTVLQFVVTGSCLAAFLLAMLDIRWFNIVPTAEMRGLPDRAAAMPVPDDWRLTRTEEGVDDDVKVPNAYVLQVYDVPDSVALRAWLSAPTWADDPDGRSFGAIRVEHCDEDGESCSAHLMPPAGQQPEFFVTAARYGAAGGARSVQIRLSYRQYVAPTDLAVSPATLERASLMPVPVDWVRLTVDGGGRGVTTSENYEQSFGVPDTFAPADLDAWLASPAWTSPASGPAFGAIALDQPCREREFFPGYVCDVTVSAPPDAGVAETFEVSLEPDHTVVLRFTRDW
ncbi:hypothetical protein RB608_03075 [Nocardioides sp. LHD-245]|uniref:hypothetical protein n=1 Tax=Nocardioides sp. LHD-245 TaxID=3051387 RepID=UPI0027E101F9|nr:hypothetical protein [Nocardioides sp. LHD-245]